MSTEVSAFSSYNSPNNKKSKKPTKNAENKSKPNLRKKQKILSVDGEVQEISKEGKATVQHKKRKRNINAESNGDFDIEESKKPKLSENVNGFDKNLENVDEKITKKKANKSANKKEVAETAETLNKTPNSEETSSERIEKKKKKENSKKSTKKNEFSQKKTSEKTEFSKHSKKDDQITKSSSVYSNSIEEGASLLSWLLSPITLDEFFQKYWEKDVLMLAQRNSEPFESFVSFEMIDQMLLENHVEFTKNIDITSFKNGVRKTHNPDGRALPPAVWEQYSMGHSIRLLNPQTFLPSVYSLCTTLQEFFHCMVGANVYLTPPNSQGFAPHYDDIEAFVLQIEGRKRWKLYNPRFKDEILPRTSSKNFSLNEIGEPILNEVLSPGDMLYFPRGTIHQACTEPGYHSLHITVSVYQKQSYADLFEIMLPLMLNKMIAKSIDIRRGVPMNIWQNAGIVYSDVDTKQRQEFLIKCRDLMTKCIEDLPIDEAIDQMAKKFQHEALPPNLTEDEIDRTIFGSKSILDKNGECFSDYEITITSKIRLTRAHILHLVEEDGILRVYYHIDNSREYREYKPNLIEITREDASSIDCLIKCYPEYISVSELPVDDDERKISISLALWEAGLVMLENPINQNKI